MLKTLGFITLLLPTILLIGISSIIPALILTGTINQNMNEISVPRSLFSFTTPENIDDTTIIISDQIPDTTSFLFEKSTNGTQLPVTFFASNCDNRTVTQNINVTLSIESPTVPRIIYGKYLLAGSNLTVTLTFTEQANLSFTYLVLDNDSQAIEFSQITAWSEAYTEVKIVNSPFIDTLFANQTSFYYIGINGLMEFDGMINFSVQGIVIQHDGQHSMDEVCKIDKAENTCLFSVQENRYSENSSLCLFASHPSTNISNNNLQLHSFYFTGSTTVISTTFLSVIISLAVIGFICLIIFCVILALIFVCK